MIVNLSYKSERNGKSRPDYRISQGYSVKNQPVTTTTAHSNQIIYRLTLLTFNQCLIERGIMTRVGMNAKCRNL